MQFFKTRWQNHRLVYICVLLMAILSVFFTAHNEFLYSKPVGKVTEVQTISHQNTVDEFKNRDTQIKQKLTLIIMNGRHYHQVVHATNLYSKSGGMDQKYRVGQEAFLTQVSSKKGKLTANVSGLKRDTPLVILFWIMVLLLIAFLGRAGVYALISVFLNIALFIVALLVDFNTQASYLVLIFAIFAFCVAAVTLVVIFGWSKLTFASLGATVLGVSLAVLTFFLVNRWTNGRGIYYESMQYVTENYRMLYLAQVMIGSLGAVMDESSDILSTMFELARLKPHTGWLSFFQAGRTVGQAVMGPLTNVLLMIFLFSTLTNSVLLLRNGNSWGYTFSMSMGLGVAQSLVSGIGIVITVPVISLLAAIILARGNK